MEFISNGHLMKLSQHIIDKHHGKMYLPFEMIKDQFIVEGRLAVSFFQIDFPIIHSIICTSQLYHDAYDRPETI